ncbi:MAG TPA: 50S ribosomal protein L24 [Spirochaetia bacterium]|nr:50S ribosomal protein L24 [Spirochaetia bacterium]
MSEKKPVKQTVKLKRDDNVRVIAGKEKGKAGRILRIDRAGGRVFIQGINMVKKAVKKQKQNDRGGIIDIEGSVDVSNVMIICPKCGPTRIAYKIEGESKVRVCRKCGGPL